MNLEFICGLVLPYIKSADEHNLKNGKWGCAQAFETRQ